MSIVPPRTAPAELARAAGVTEDDLARLRGPIGLDLGGREPAETALSNPICEGRMPASSQIFFFLKSRTPTFASIKNWAACGSAARLY